MTALVTLEEYKVYKKITKTDEDATLNFIIASVSTLVKNYCGHSFVDYFTNNKVEYFNVNQFQDALLLNEWPIVELVSVETRANYSDSYEIVPPEDYFVDFRIDTIFKHSGYWRAGKGSVRATYKAGYSTAPEDAKIACLDLVTHYLKSEYKETKTIGSSSINNASSMGSSLKASTTWPAHILRVLDLYKNG